MTDLLRGHGKGEWAPYIVDEYGDNPRWSAVIRCAECGKPLVLKDHHIAADGQVSPSVGHPPAFLPCGWHPTPRLVGWENSPPPPVRSFVTCARCGKQSRSIGWWSTHGQYPDIICRECFTAIVPALPPNDGGEK